MTDPNETYPAAPPLLSRSAERTAQRDEERAVRFALETMMMPPRRRSPWLRWVVGFLLIAGALVVAGRTWGKGAATVEAADRFLGESGIEMVVPSGSVKRFERLLWRDVDGVGHAYDVDVWDVSAAGERQLLLRKRGVRGTQVVLDPAAAASWPDSIEWWVGALDVTGQRIAGAEGRERSSRFGR